MKEQKKDFFKTTTTKSRKTDVKTEESGRLQPQARDFEEAILGALMLEKDAYSIVNETLSPECFYDKNHDLIYAAIQELAINQKPIDILTVVEQLRKNGDLEIIGGASYIAQLSQRVVSSAHIDYHARIVAQKYLARELISFSSVVTNQAFDETNDVEDLMEQAEVKLFEIAQRSVKKDVIHISPIIKEALKLMHEASTRTDGLSGLASGFDDLDKITSGWQNSDLIIIAARPAMGKTAFVLSMAKNMAVSFQTPVAFFSLEMSNVQLVNRLIVNVSELSGEKIKTGQLNKDEWIHLDRSLKDLYSAPIYIDDTPSLSILELRTKARRLVKEHHVKCIFIDYLQLMTASSKEGREKEVGMISGNLKSLAKELNIPVIALSQMNRSIEMRTTKSPDGFDAKRRPQLSDLRESGAIEQDADIVCFIHRPEYYLILQDEEGNDLTGVAEIIIAKHRNGSTGNVRLSFKKDIARFQNRDKFQNQGDDQSYAVYRSQVDSMPLEKSKSSRKVVPQSDNESPY